MIYEYLIFNLVVLGLSSLGIKVKTGYSYPKFKLAMVAITIVAIPYIVWDHMVTGIWWWFNPLYITGINIGKLPIEEIMFFISVPWSCLVIWENLKKIIKGKRKVSVDKLLIFLMILLVFSLLYLNKVYLSSVIMVNVIVLVLYKKLFKDFNVKALVVFDAVVVLLTTIFNGYLTAKPVVLYAEALSLFKIITIPIEDYLYGIALVNAVVLIYEKLIKGEAK